MSSEISTASSRISDLARAYPADRTVQNLLTTLSAKLELCARLPVFQYEAETEGRTAEARAFQDLVEAEARSFKAMLDCLRHHLNETAPGGQAAAPASDEAAPR